MPNNQFYICLILASENPSVSFSGPKWYHLTYSCLFKVFFKISHFFSLIFCFTFLKFWYFLAQKMAVFGRISKKGRNMLDGIIMYIPEKLILGLWQAQTRRIFIFCYHFSTFEHCALGKKKSKSYYFLKIIFHKNKLIINSFSGLFLTELVCYLFFANPMQYVHAMHVQKCLSICPQ